MRRGSLHLLILCSALLSGLTLASCQPSSAPGPQIHGDLRAPLGADPDCRVARVIDGDTVDLSCTGTGRFRARLTGYDTPEAFEPGCTAEAQVARAATERLRNLVGAARSVEASFSGTDRYGRRLVRLSLDGSDVGATLIAEGLAVPYGGGRRIDWCTRLG